MLNGLSLGAALWRRRGTALLAFVVVAAATTAWLLFAPRAYTATASVTATPSAELAPSHGTVEQLQDTIAGLAASAPVLTNVVDRLGPRRSVATLQHEVRAERVDGTAIIRVHVSDSDRIYAARVANTIITVLPSYDPTRGGFSFENAGVAVVPSGFSSPDVATIVVIGVLVGVLVAVSAALLRERLSGRVDDPRQLASLAGVPVLASVTRPADPAELLTEAQSGPNAVEFRALRVALEFATSDAPTSLVVVAPAQRDAAAAWTTMGLAGTLAQVEHRVLVVDADFAASTPHPAFKSKGPGLADVLRGNVELRDAVRPTPISGVSLLPVGKLGGASAATLVELRFHRAIAQIDKEVDVILVHSAPLAESDDAVVMAAGSALLVTVPAGRLRGRAVRDLAASLRRMRLRVVGSVLLTGRAVRHP